MQGRGGGSSLEMKEVEKWFTVPHSREQHLIRILEMRERVNEQKKMFSYYKLSDAF